MLIMGIQFLRDCPKEPNIPVYMVVGGSVGCIKMGLTLWSQLHTRRTDTAAMNATSIGSKVASVALTILLITWFSLGNYWILHIKWPDYAPTLFEPNRWCHKTLYVFSLVHLCIIYSLIGMVVILVIILAGCQLFGCPWLGPTRFK
ncbi:hypothetical protein JTB14_024405 [Gonioctena quinquepunctata]|nr:hypothetical protein JTB14_024405 [Gonioctena quinquepunctata]